MDRRSLRKGLHEMGGISPQAFPTVSSVTGGHEFTVTAVPAVVANGWCTRAGQPLPGDPDATCQDMCFGLVSFVPASQSESTSAAMRFCIRSRARVRRARAISTAAFSLRWHRPDEDADRTRKMPVYSSDVRAARKMTTQCHLRGHCRDNDLRSSFPQSDLSLHFLFQSARIGLGRSVKED